MAEGQTTLESSPRMMILSGNLHTVPGSSVIPLPIIHHYCGDAPATSALCNFRADDALGSVLIAPITAVHFVTLNNVISDWSCLVDENGIFFPVYHVYIYWTYWQYGT